MTEPKWTPRPWDFEWVSAKASGGGHLYIIDSTGRKIAAIWGKAEEKEFAARLIAAAPELFEALVAAEEELRLIRMKDTSATYNPILRTQITLVLAKARGQP
jgi:hypothetical protein